MNETFPVFDNEIDHRINNSCIYGCCCRCANSMFLDCWSSFISHSRNDSPLAVEQVVAFPSKPELSLTAADSGVRYVGSTGAVLSAGTRIKVDYGPALVEVDLAAYNFSAANLGTLRARGYSGGSACIAVERFYRRR